jgi:hypothetical protein
MSDREPSPSKPQIGIAADLFAARQLFRPFAEPPYSRTAALVIFPKKCELLHTASRAPRLSLSRGRSERAKQKGLYQWRFRISLAGSQQVSSSPPSRREAWCRFARSPLEAMWRSSAMHTWRACANSAPSFDHAAAERTAPAPGDHRPRGGCSGCRRRSAGAPFRGDRSKRQLEGAADEGVTALAAP